MQRRCSPSPPHGGANWRPLLDPDMPVPGVTVGALRPAIAAIAVPTTTDGRNMIGEDFAVMARDGDITEQGDVVMPGQGRMVERAYTPDERASRWVTPCRRSVKPPFDIYLNARTFWRNVPAAQVWTYKLGGYQILKKWLSYREREILGRMADTRGYPTFYRHRPADRRDRGGSRRVVRVTPSPRWCRQNGGRLIARP